MFHSKSFCKGNLLVPRRQYYAFYEEAKAEAKKGPRPLAVVTGCSRGIGRAITFTLVREGYRVAGLSRSEVGGLQSLGEHFTPLRCDVRSVEEIEQTVQKIVAELGSPSVLVNAAGVSHDSLLLRLKADEVLDTLNTNLIGPMFLSKALAKEMVKQKQGHIINIGSVVGSQGNAGQSSYSASKSAWIGLTRTWAKELAPKNIRVNLIEPGYIETDMTNGFSDEKKKELIEAIPLKRFGTPEEVAHVVLFLLRSPYMTGQVLTVDGGLTL